MIFKIYYLFQVILDFTFNDENQLVEADFPESSSQVAVHSLIGKDYIVKYYFYMFERT